MRVLAILNGTDYVNPTSALVQRGLKARPGVVMGGPGHQGPTPGSIAELTRRHGRFDVVMIDLILVHEWVASRRGVPPSYLPWVPHDLFDCGLPLVCSLLRVDQHGLDDTFYSRILPHFAAAVSTIANPQIFADWPPAEARREPWFNTSPARHGKRVMPENMLLLPHCVAPQEFRWRRFPRRRHDVSLLGDSYYFRRRAREYLLRGNRHRVKLLRDALQLGLGYVATRGAWGAQVPGVLWLYRKRFIDAIANSRVSVTCDGSISYAVRKFFEIPALGAILAAKFFPEAGILGFRDGENCFALDEDRLERLDEIIDFARSDSAAAGRIAEVGQALIRDCHGVATRVDQLWAILEAVASGRSFTARWQDGHQRLLDRKAAELPA